MARLPTPGGDDGTWGDILNSFLEVSLNSDGTIQPVAITQAGALLSSQVGTVNGVASLNSSGQVPSSQLGSGSASSSTYLRGDGTWSMPNSASSSLASDSDVTIVSPSSGQVLTYSSSASKWENEALPSAPVASVFGRTGAITAQSGDYTASQVGALPSTDDLSAIAAANPTAGNVGLNSHKITNLVNGSAATDAAAFGQIPTSFPPSGTAGGDLSGSYPNPTVAKIKGISLPSSAPSANQVLTATSNTTASWTTPATGPGTTVSSSGDTSGATDQAAITAAEALGKTIYFAPGTYYVTGLIKQAGTLWQGSGRLETIIQLANGANADVVQGESFSSLTLSGSVTGGIGGWGIRDLTIDGNQANQSGTSYGLRVYGYNFDLTRIAIRNCLTDGLYTEWGNFGGSGIPGNDMEATLFDVQIHNNGGNGWHNRGPHDSRAYDVTIYENGSGQSIGYWCESAGVGTSVTASSNGVNVATFAGSGTLSVATVLNFPSASINAAQGSLSVETSGGTAVITYTGTSGGNTFTGCTTVSGSGTLSTGNTVTAAGVYSASGTLLHGCHVWGASNHLYDYQLDCSSHLTDCIGEVPYTNGAMVLLRGSGQSVIMGGLYFVAIGTSPGAGIVVGDAVNEVTGVFIDTQISGMTGGSSNLASIALVNEGGSNTIMATVYQTANAAYTGTPNLQSVHDIRLIGQPEANSGSGSFRNFYGQFQQEIPASVNEAWRLSANGSDVLNINTSTPQVTVNNAYELNLYSDSYITKTVRILGANGHIGTGIPSGKSVGVAAASGAGTSPPTPVLVSLASDTQGQVGFGTGTGPTAGSQVSITFATAFTNTPVVVVSAVNSATAALAPYVSSNSASGFNIALANVPAASQAEGTYVVNYIAIARGA